MSKTTTFFEALQINTALDLRDIRGKRHNLALILTQFMLGLLCNRDGNMSSIHRHMKAHYSKMVADLSLENSVPKKQYLVRIYL